MEAEDDERQEGMMANRLDVGTVVRDRRWGGKFSGTVVARQGRSVFVAWHGTCVEDELEADQVEIWPGAPDELARWRGGVGVLRSDGTLAVKPASDLAHS